MLIILFDISGIVRKEFVLAGQTVSTALAVASRQRAISQFLFHQEIFDRKQNDCRPPATLLSRLGPLRLDTTEVNEAESQAVLNTLM
jgi:hypothetical protein